MLEVAMICPRCGKHLPDTPSASAVHLSRGGCRPMVYAALPEPEPVASESDVPLTPAGRRIHDFETPLPHPAPVSAFPRSSFATARTDPTRSLAIPWLRPPDLGEVL